MKTTLVLSVVLACVFASAFARNAYCGVDVSDPPRDPTYSSVPSGYKLSLVQVLIRHGDRLPIDRCWANENTWGCNLSIEERSMPGSATFENVTRLHRKNYLNNDNTFPGTCMSGQLTKYGYDQHLVNGAYLRRQYGSYLPVNFVSQAMSLRSTDVPRTLQSAQALVRGMYSWSDNLAPTQVVDYYTVDAAREWWYPNPGNCPKLAKYEADAKQSAGFKEWQTSTLAPLMAKLAPYYNLPVDRMPSPINAFDCLSAHMCHKMPVPGNLPESLHEQVIAAMEFEYKFIYNYPDRLSYGTLGMGRAHYDVYNEFRNVANNGASPSTPLFRLYSAHDTSVMPFLNAIGAWDGIWAPYASLVQMEMYTSPGKTPLIRYIYNRKELVLPGCSGAFCPFDQYTSLVQPLFQADWNTACSIPGTIAERKEQLGVYTHNGCAT